MKSLALTLVAIVFFFVVWIVLINLPKEAQRQLEPWGPRGYLLPWDCEQCQQDYMRKRISAPHGHPVKYIAPQDCLKIEGDFWRFYWQGSSATAYRKSYVFLPSEEPCPAPYLAYKLDDFVLFPEALGLLESDVP